MALGIELSLPGTLILTALTTVILYFVFVPPDRLITNNGVPILKCGIMSGLGGIGFYQNRYKFLDSPFIGIRKFNIIQKIVYTFGTTDEEEIKSFALNRDLSFSQGNNFLFAGIGGAKQNGLNEYGEMDKSERKEMMMLAQSISPRRLTDMRKKLIADSLSSFESWPSKINLHETYYPLVFRFTVRLLGPAEYADNPAKLKALMRNFWRTQDNSDFFTTHLPWIPLPNLLKRLWGAMRLWWMVSMTITKRHKYETKEDDYAQELVDKRLRVSQITRFVIGAIIAGTLNTIGIGAYTVAFLGASQSLRTRAREEIQSHLQTKYPNIKLSSSNIKELLESITLEEWEDPNVFATVHLCFKEVIRLLLTNSLNRYYPGPSMKNKKTGEKNDRLKILGHEIEDDVYITFEPSAILHNDKLYPEAMRFNPDRYLDGKLHPNPETEYNYIAWGAGHHKCTGIRFAKLETITAIVSLLCWSEDFHTEVDGEKVKSPNEVPLSDLSQKYWRTPASGQEMRVVLAKRS